VKGGLDGGGQAMKIVFKEKEKEFSGRKDGAVGEMLKE